MTALSVEAPPGPRLKAISCPTCGGSAGSLTPGDIRLCRYCGVPLTLVAPGVSGSASIEPEIPYEAARHVVEQFLATPGASNGLKERAARRGLDLVYVPFFDILLIQAAEERLPVRCRLGVSRLTAIAIEDDGRALGADRIDTDRVRGATPEPFDAAALASKGTVLEPQRRPESINLPNILSAPVTIERRVRVVYYPVWLARFSYGRSLYQVAVDGLTGAVLRGVAPAAMSRRVLAGVGFTLLFSVLLAVAVASPRILLELVRHGLDVGAFVLGGLLLVLAAAWDRLRFRRELVVEGAARKFQPINRPKETTLEAAAKTVLDFAKSRGRRTVTLGRGGNLGWVVREVMRSRRGRF